MSYLNMENAVLLDSIDTSRIILQVWGTQFAIAVPHCEERLFVIRTYHKKKDKCTIRYGNRTQVNSILKAYKKEKRFHL